MKLYEFVDADGIYVARKANGTVFPRWIIVVILKGKAMKFTTIAVAAALALYGTFAYAQGGAPSGRGSTTGDPAASSATSGTSPTTGSSMKPSPSGSGTSTSGGSDANGDQGRDKCPTAVRA
jgi:hypothetical protein